MTARVLVLDGHSRAALECVQSLGRAGARVEVAAAAPDARALRSRHVRARHRQPADGAAFARWLSRLAELSPFDLLLPTTETSLGRLLAHPARARFLERAVLAPPPALDLALDKQRTWEHARAVGVPVPEGLCHPRGAPPGPGPGLPAVLKTVTSKVQTPTGLRAATAFLARDEAARRAWLAGWLPHVAVQEQRWVPGTGVGVEVLYERGRLRWAFAHRRLHEWPLSGGASTWREAIEVPPALRRATQALLDPLDWHGVAMAEYRVAEDGAFVLLEINPRLWGSLALARDAGVDFPRGLLALAQGRDPGPQPRVRVGMRTRLLPEDLEWLRANWSAPRDDPLLCVRPRLASLGEWLGLCTGREGVDHADARDPAPLRALLVVYARTKAAGLAARAAALAGRAAGRLVPRRLPVGPVRRIEVLCYGNICRSPLVAALGRRLAPHLEWASAGFHLPEGRPTPADFAAVARQAGVDLDAHRSRRVRGEDLAHADLILVMDRSNIARLRREHPALARRAVLLGPFGPDRAAEIPDPYALDPAAQARVVEQARRALEGLLAALGARGALGGA